MDLERFGRWSVENMATINRCAAHFVRSFGLHGFTDPAKIVNEAVVNLIPFLSDYPEKALLRAFRTTMRRLALDEVEERKKVLTSHDVGGLPVKYVGGGRNVEDEACDQALINFEETKRISKAVMDLPTKQRLAIGYRIMLGSGMQEVAESVGYNPEADHANAYEARKKLREWGVGPPPEYIPIYDGIGNDPAAALHLARRSRDMVSQALGYPVRETTADHFEYYGTELASTVARFLRRSRRVMQSGLETTRYLDRYWQAYRSVRDRWLRSPNQETLDELVLMENGYELLELALFAVVPPNDFPVFRVKSGGGERRQRSFLHRKLKSMYG